MAIGRKARPLPVAPILEGTQSDTPKRVAATVLLEAAFVIVPMLAVGGLLVVWSQLRRR